jgi:hypothetical protein
MSLDCWQETAPCLCGKGQFVINHWSTDWRAGENLEVACEDCDREYSITLTAFPGPCIAGTFFRRTSHRLSFTRRSDVKAHNDAWDTRERLWQTDPDVVALQEELCSMLQSLKAATARHRWLKERGLYRESLTLFRRSWKHGSDDVVRSIVRWNSERFACLEAARARYDVVPVPKIRYAHRLFDPTAS